jgi:hypothetical protein
MNVLMCWKLCRKCQEGRFYRLQYSRAVRCATGAGLRCPVSDNSHYGRIPFGSWHQNCWLTPRFTSLPSDIFSLSMIFSVLGAHTPLFAKIANEHVVERHIRTGQRHVGLHTEVEEGSWQLIENMWAPDLSIRPSTGDLQRRLGAILLVLRWGCLAT